MADAHIEEVVKKKIDSIFSGNAYAGAIPEDVSAPMAAIHVTSEVDMGRDFNGESTLWNYGVQVNVYCTSPEDRADKQRAVRVALKNLTEVVSVGSNSPQDTLDVKSSQFNGRNDFSHLDMDPPIFHAQLDFRFTCELTSS